MFKGIILQNDIFRSQEIALPLKPGSSFTVWTVKNELGFSSKRATILCNEIAD